MNIAAIFPTTGPYRTSDNQIQQVGSGRRQIKRRDHRSGWRRQSHGWSSWRQWLCFWERAVLISPDAMKYSKPSGGMAACDKRTIRATPVLLLAVALLGTSAPAVTFTWDGGSIGDTGESDVVEKLLLNTESGTVTFGEDVRPNPTSGTALTFSPGGTRGNRHAITFGPTGDFNIRRIFGGVASPLPREATTCVRSGILTIAANVASAADDAHRTMGHATLAVFVGGTSMASLSSLLTGCSFTVGRAAAVQSGSPGMETPGRITRPGDRTVVENGENRAGGRPDGGMFDSTGGILNANNQNENMIGALSLTANSTVDLDAGEGTASPRFVTASTTGATLPINAWSDPADTSRPDDSILIMADPATSGALGQIEFTNDVPGATLSGRLIVPVPEPINVALGIFGVGFVMFGIGRRFCARANARRNGVITPCKT